MIKIDPDCVYERAEIAEAFPSMSPPALTRCLLAWGGRRPYGGSRKVFIVGRAILTALGSPQTDEPPPPADSGTAGSSPRPRALPQACVPRRKVWSGDGEHH
jgi:hypothetical protein